MAYLSPCQAGPEGSMMIMMNKLSFTAYRIIPADQIQNTVYLHRQQQSCPTKLNILETSAAFLL
ncbi:hypothetical protein BFC17_13825 [Alteromonas lipolytica]|uniref:Uncharacterized protein n=1 Tax=Alteromonas lipolytica TaxID=1856405 RepID=A0A1E8FFF8_9ALTE|nr:hypothetical protein BFC17_13825 [Alteromonas lipolytica]